MLWFLNSSPPLCWASWPSHVWSVSLGCHIFITVWLAKQEEQRRPVSWLVLSLTYVGWTSLQWCGRYDVGVPEGTDARYIQNGPTISSLPAYLQSIYSKLVATCICNCHGLSSKASARRSENLTLNLLKPSVTSDPQGHCRKTIFEWILGRETFVVIAFHHSTAKTHSKLKQTKKKSQTNHDVIHSYVG